MTQRLAEKLMLDRYPAMKHYIHLLSWTPTDSGDFFDASRVPEPLQTQINEWHHSKLEEIERIKHA